MGERFPIQFGKYLLLEKIATGGMAELFRAMIAGDQGFEKIVAIKRILPHLTDQQEFVHAFIDEAKLAALLQHPNIVQVYDFGSIQGSYFISMEHLFGQDLDSIMARSKEKRSPLALHHVVSIVSRICEGLDYAHKLKDLQGQPLHLIHRDVNPVNILVTYEGEVKIVDFGIAKATGKNTKTREGLIKGKIGYMSPEQASGNLVDHRSDIFSTGIILYEMLTAEPMYRGEDLEILAQVQEARFEPPENLNPDLPPELCKILCHALEKDPASRYQSAGELLTDLENCGCSISPRLAAQSVAQLMTTLFCADIEAGHNLMARLSEISSPDAESTGTPFRGKSLERTRFLTSYPAKQKTTRKAFWYAVATPILLGGLLIFSMEDNPFSGIHSSSVPSVQAYLSTGPRSGQHGKSLASAKFNTAMEALGEERFDEAASLFEELLSDRPHLASQISVYHSQALSGQALRLMQKDPDRAETLFILALQMDPNNLRARFELGSFYFTTRNYPKAIEAYQNVIKRDPDFHRAVFNLAFIYASKQDYAMAEQMYQRVIDLSPPYADEAHFNLAVIQSKQGRKTQSIANLEKALAMNPKNQVARNYLNRLRGSNRS
jgi:serine/threonine protein kinase/Tfp pilus assembly protein PilF